MSIYNFVNILQEGHIRHLGQIRHLGHIRHSEYIRHLGHTRHLKNVNMQRIKNYEHLIMWKGKISMGHMLTNFSHFSKKNSNCNFMILKSLQPDVADFVR